MKIGSQNYVNRNVSFTPEMLEELENVADLEERSVSAAVRMAVKIYLREKRKIYPKLKK